MKTCTVESCERKHYGRGFCALHHQRWWKHGDPLKLLRGGRPPGGVCEVNGCEKPQVGRGFCDTHYQANKRERVKLALRATKLASGCVDCGYAEHPAALQWDHIKGVKKFNLSKAADHPWEEVLAEIEKCEVRCANCHAIRTHGPEHEFLGVIFAEVT